MHFNCSKCGKFVSFEKGVIDPPRYVYTADYWNGPNEVQDAWCEKHIPENRKQIARNPKVMA